MKKLLAACAIVGATASVASAQEFKSYAGAEYQTESEKQNYMLEHQQMLEL